MAGFTLTTSRFPDGTVVGAYLAANWLPDQEFGGPPHGTAVDEQTMSGGTATFSGLEAGVSYVAAGEVAGDWGYIHFTVARQVVQSGYSSVNSGMVSTTDPSKWVTLDIIEGIEVPGSGRLGISYAALFKQAEWVEVPEVDNHGECALFLDDAQIAHPGGSPIVSTFLENTPYWESLWTRVDGNLAPITPAEDAPAYGAFLGAAFMPIAAAPGLHSVSFRVKMGEPTGGKFSVKERRLVAITGDV